MSLEVAGQQQGFAQPTLAFSQFYAAGDEIAAVEVAIHALSVGAPFDPPFESVWWLADELRRGRHFTLARSLVEHAFEKGFRGWRILYLRGVFQALTRNFDKAVKLLDSAASQAPEEEARKIRILKGRLLSAIGHDVEAVKCFKPGPKFGHDPERVINLAVRLAWRVNDEKLALQWDKLANAAYGRSVFRSLLSARSYVNGGEWKKARVAAAKGLAVDPENEALLRLVCRCLHQEGKHVQAIGALEDRLRQDNGWTEGRLLLARSLMSGGRREEALAALNFIQPAERGEEVILLIKKIRNLDERGACEDQDADEKKYRKQKADPLEDSEVKFRLSNIPDDFRPRWTPEVIAASGSTTRAFKSLVHSVRTIMLREMMARFGRHDLGYLWAIIEPLIHVSILSFIFYFIRMRDTLGMNVVLFVATGIIPLFFYLKTFAVLTNALKQNRPLLNHSGVQPMDIFLARSILEFFTQLLVLILFVVVIYVAVEQYRFGSVVSIMANLFGLWIMGIGAGLTVGSLVVYAESLPNIVSGFNRIIYITSGVFFTLDMMPPAVAEYAAYNPLLHFVDGVRGNFNPLMGGTRVDIVYGFSWAVGILAFGLVADRALRHRVLDR